MENQKLIETTVEQNPGIRFTELKERTGLANGVLQYHLRNSDLLTRKKNSILTRGFCEDCEFREFCRSKCVYGVLRDPVNREVLKRHLKGENNTDIAAVLDLNPSTITYHLGKLRNLELID